MIEIFISSLLVYIYVSILLRLLGKKEFSKLNVFDFVVFLILAELMTLSIEGSDFTFFHSMVATLTLVGCDRIITQIALKSKKSRDILEGRPNYLIYNNKLNIENMKLLRYSIDDLCHQLRVNGVDSISDVQFALVERNGTLSVIQKKDCKTILPEPLILDGEIDEIALHKLQKDKTWLLKELKKRDYQDPSIIFFCMLEKTGLYIIEK